jgi:hypothetical protein
MQAFAVFLMRNICTAHLILSVLIIHVIFREEYKL